MPDWRTRIRRAALTLVTPSLADLFFVALLVVAFGRPLTLQALLADGDTGWHIRTGDFILQARAVPVHDLFSFSRPDAPWFSWEWLSDVLFALGHRWQGLSGVAGLSAAVLCLAATCLLYPAHVRPSVSERGQSLLRPLRAARREDGSSGAAAASDAG